MAISGRFRHRVSIEDYVETLNSHGEAVRTWTEFSRPWAEVLGQSSKEVQLAQQVNAEITHLVKIRWQCGINSKMRVKLIHEDDRILNIAGTPIPDRTHRRQIKMTCIEDSDATD